MKSVLSIAATAFGFVMVSSSAFAGGGAVAVPEPLSMSLLAGGIVAIAAVKRMRHK